MGCCDRLAGSEHGKLGRMSVGHDGDDGAGGGHSAKIADNDGESAGPVGVMVEMR